MQPTPTKGVHHRTFQDENPKDEPKNAKRARQITMETALHKNKANQNKVVVFPLLQTGRKDHESFESVLESHQKRNIFY
jgi:hypothetical protein